MDLVLPVLVGIVVVIIITIGSIIYLYFFRLWFRTHIAHCSVPLGTIFAIFFRKGNPQVVINAYIRAHKAGFSLALDDLEAHYKSKGDVKGVISALIEAQTGDIDVTFEELCRQDLDRINS